MTRKEYKDILNYELYRDRRETFLNRLRIKYLQPNTNCMFLARKMWYLNSQGGIKRVLSKLLYLKILHRYGCIFFPNINVGRGFFITHPVGIVLGRCSIGENFTLYQNTSIGIKNPGDEANKLWPCIGNNVTLTAGSYILGNVTIVDNVVIGANSLVIKSILEPGTYVGNPCKITRG